MIAVTSCDPGEGKTSVSTNIAWALAAQDRHVTAIDCDLRKPALHTQMGVPFGPGVTSRRTEDALAHASRTPNPYLDVIPAGIIDRHPSDIVSAHLPLLIEQLRERHETAVIDCPPLIGVAETVLIATMVDLVIVVVDARRFNPERLQQCLLRLDTANTNVAIVLNRVRFNRKRRDGTYGYGHFRRADAPPAAVAPAAPSNTGRPGVSPRAPVSNGRRRPASSAPTPCGWPSRPCSGRRARRPAGHPVPQADREPRPDRLLATLSRAGRVHSSHAGRAHRRRRGSRSARSREPRRGRRRSSRPWTRAGIRATFFVQGRWVAANPEAAAAIGSSGHLVGNHSYYHADTRLPRPRGVRAGRDQGARARSRTSLGVDARPWYRLPYGAGAESPRITRQLRALGYRHVGWDVDVDDYAMTDRDALVPAIDKAITERERAGATHAIVLLHSWPPATAAAMPELCRFLVERCEGDRDRRPGAGTTVPCATYLAARGPGPHSGKRTRAAFSHQA